LPPPNESGNDGKPSFVDVFTVPEKWSTVDCCIAVNNCAAVRAGSRGWSDADAVEVDAVSVTTTVPAASTGATAQRKRRLCIGVIM
jgi:hypothetical protein